MNAYLKAHVSGEVSSHFIRLHTVKCRAYLDT
jgi:hypothetical protein